MSTPLISARTIGRLPEIVALASSHSVVSKVFAAADLPEAAASNPDTFIPQKNLIRFIRESALAVGDRNFGLFIAPHLSVSDYGQWGGYLLGATSLEQALVRLPAALRYHSSHDRIWVLAEGDEITVRYQVPTRGVIGYRHFAVAAASVVISLLRGFGPARWLPLRVELDIPRPASPDRYEEMFGCPVIFEGSCIAVTIERHALGFSPVPAIGRRQITYSDLRRVAAHRAPRDLVAAVAEIIRLRLLDTSIELDAVARTLELGPRTLQRRLNDEGTDFRALVSNVRAGRALEMLRETDLPMIDIAVELGYSSASHFTRAFRKTSGRLPRDIRNASARRAGSPQVPAAARA